MKPFVYSSREFALNCLESEVHIFIYALCRPVGPDGGRVARFQTGVNSTSRVGAELTAQNRPDRTPATLHWASRRTRKGNSLFRTRGKALQSHHLPTHAHNMSCLAHFSSLFKSTKRISQGAVCSESQRQRYASLSSLCLLSLRANLAHGAAVHILHRSTSLMTTHFSTSFISIGHFF